MTIAIKRVYEAASRTDGVRVLVDRSRPRGLTKASAALDERLRDLAPSDELRRWYHAHSDSEEAAKRAKRSLAQLPQRISEGLVTTGG